jgi:exosortase/archaeosortase family protein
MGVDRLFLATVPIAILANGFRVTVAGILSQFRPELAEGFFHESTGWVIFMNGFMSSRPIP